MHGNIDLTVPSGASSVCLIDCGRCDSGTDLSVMGEMNRSLKVNTELVQFLGDLLVVQVEQELVVQTFDVLDGRDDGLEVLILSH